MTLINMSSTATLVAKFNGGFINSDKYPKLIVNGGELAYYNNPLEIMGGELSNDEYKRMLTITVAPVNNNRSSNTNEIKPFKSYMSNMLDNIVI